MKRTTTSNLMSIISSKAARVENVILRYSSGELDKKEIESNKFIKSLKHLNKSGIFADAVDWKYDIVHVSNEDEEDFIMVRGGRIVSFMNCTIDFQLRACEDVAISDLEKILGDTFF